MYVGKRRRLDAHNHLEDAETDEERRDLFISRCALAKRLVGTDCTLFATVAQEAKDFEAYKWIGIPTYEQFIEEKFGRTIEEMEDIILGVKILGGGTEKDVRAAAVAYRAKHPKELVEHRRPTNKEADHKPDNVRFIGLGDIGGNSANYLTARIARDHPDILARMQAGEFKSVRQAAIAAGIVKVPSQLDVALKAYGKLDNKDKVKFRKTINEE